MDCCSPRDEHDLASLTAILTHETVNHLHDVARRRTALNILSAAGGAASAALPAVLQTLVVPISIDCGLLLRVAAAEAVWKIGGRRDLALPFLIYALKDEYWGASLQASQVLSEMRGQASEAVVDLIDLADRRLSKGPFRFENFRLNSPPLLAVVATAIGQCGRGLERRHEVSDALMRIATSGDSDVRKAALNALKSVEGADRSQRERMPVILPERQYNHRLKLQLDDAVKLQVLLKPYPAEELTAYTETRAALKSRP